MGRIAGALALDAYRSLVELDQTFAARVAERGEAERLLRVALELRLDEEAAVVLLGPHQSGKTTLALELAARRDALYLGLESEQNRARLAEPELYLADHLDRLVIVDEIHRAPGLFPVLRGPLARAALHRLSG